MKIVRVFLLSYAAIFALAVVCGVGFWFRWPAAQKFAFITNRTTHFQPNATASRFRLQEYADLPQQEGRFFFQWWNYLIYDSVTHEHWNFIYQFSDYSANATDLEDTVSIGLRKLHRQMAQIGATARFPMSSAVLSNSMDVQVDPSLASGEYRFSQIASEDGNTIHLFARFRDDEISKLDGSQSGSLEYEWDLVVHRRHGVFTNQDQEDGNRDLCLIVSYLSGFHSTVRGKMTEREFHPNGTISDERVVTFDDDSRYRVYSAGSYGCDLPNGEPPQSYPWTWMWLVVPQAVTSAELALAQSDIPPSIDQRVAAASDENRADMSMVLGTARFQLPSQRQTTEWPAVILDIDGGFFGVGMGEQLLTAVTSSMSVRSRIGAQSSDSLLQPSEFETTSAAENRLNSLAPRYLTAPVISFSSDESVRFSALLSLTEIGILQVSLAIRLQLV